MDLDYNDFENDMAMCELTLRNFRVAALLGTFSNLQELKIASQWGNKFFYPDFIDAIRNSGFKNLKCLKMNISLDDAGEEFVNFFIGSISAFCPELEYLMFYGNQIKMKKNFMQVYYSYHQYFSSFIVIFSSIRLPYLPIDGRS